MYLATCINCELHLKILLFLWNSAFWTLSCGYSYILLLNWDFSHSWEWPSKQWHMKMKRTWQRSKSTAWKSLRNSCTASSSHTTGCLNSHHSPTFPLIIHTVFLAALSSLLWPVQVEHSTPLSLPLTWNPGWGLESLPSSNDVLYN